MVLVLKKKEKGIWKVEGRTMDARKCVLHVHVSLEGFREGREHIHWDREFKKSFDRSYGVTRVLLNAEEEVWE